MYLKYFYVCFYPFEEKAQKHVQIPNMVWISWFYFLIFDMLFEFLLFPTEPLIVNKHQPSYIKIIKINVKIVDTE